MVENLSNFGIFIFIILRLNNSILLLLNFFDYMYR